MKRLSALAACALISLTAACDMGGEDAFDFDPVADQLCTLGGGTQVTIDTNVYYRMVNGRPQILVRGGRDKDLGVINSLTLTIEAPAGQQFSGVAAGSAPVAVTLPTASAGGIPTQGAAAQRFAVGGSLTTPSGANFNLLKSGTLTISEAAGTRFVGKLSNVVFERAVTGTTTTTTTGGIPVGGSGIPTGTQLQPTTQQCPLVIDNMDIALQVQDVTTQQQTQVQQSQTRVRGGATCTTNPVTGTRQCNRR